MKKLKAKHGFTLLEILIGAGIITASFLGVLTVFDRLGRASRQMVELTQAGFLLTEGLEAARSWRDLGWANLGAWPEAVEYYLVWNGDRWATSTANLFLDGRFERKVAVTTAARDNGTKNIVPSGGTADPGSKLVTVTVAWSAAGATTTKTVASYLTNILAN